MTQETEAIAANYIISFYREVQILNHNYSVYLNQLLEINERHGDKGLENAEEAEKINLMSFAQNIRQNVHKTFIQYTVISGAAQLKKDKDIEKLYNVIKDTFIMPRDTLKDYVIKINTLLVNDLIKHILETSRDIIDKIYNND